MTQIQRRWLSQQWRLRVFVLVFSYLVALISALLFMSATGVITLPIGIILVCSLVIALESTAFFDSIAVLFRSKVMYKAPLAVMGTTTTGSGLFALVVDFLVTKNLAEATAWMVTITMVIGVGMLFGVSLRPRTQ